MNFSKRTDWDLRENEYTAAVGKARAAGRELIDLTVSNPTAAGFMLDSGSVLEPLSSAAAMTYEPEPFGMQIARDAVAVYYGDHDAKISADHICLTTSTSEAYSFLFRLLCNPGDEVLIARPSYPLFEFIAQLDDVQVRDYPLFYADGWHIDLHALEETITSRTKAVIVVHPNNPTGNYASAAERNALEEICARGGMTLIVDEVFLDYGFTSEQKPSFASGESDALTFVLSGISKVCALPQMKISWMIACGPDHLVLGALSRLEMIADTFLSVPAPTQHALGSWLSARHSQQGLIKARAEKNLHFLDRQLAGSQITRLPLQGGWTVVLRVPRRGESRNFAFIALAHGVIVQPGSFYGLGSGYVVLSLLTAPEMWRQGVHLLTKLAGF